MFSFKNDEKTRLYLGEIRETRFDVLKREELNMWRTTSVQYSSVGMNIVPTIP